MNLVFSLTKKEKKEIYKFKKGDKNTLSYVLERKLIKMYMKFQKSYDLTFNSSNIYDNNFKYCYEFKDCMSVIEIENLILVKFKYGKELYIPKEKLKKLNGTNAVINDLRRFTKANKERLVFSNIDSEINLESKVDKKIYLELRKKEINSINSGKYLLVKSIINMFLIIGLFIDLKVNNVFSSLIFLISAMAYIFLDDIYKKIIIGRKIFKHNKKEISFDIKVDKENLIIENKELLISNSYGYKEISKLEKTENYYILSYLKDECSYCTFIDSTNFSEGDKYNFEKKINYLINKGDSQLKLKSSFKSNISDLIIALADLAVVITMLLTI